MEYSSRHGEIEDSNGDSDKHGHHDTEGMGRSYECVFCKRGFTTAQALGGHMNIHRKDRAANKTNHRPASTHHHHSKTDHEAYNMKSSSYSPIPSYPPSPGYCHHHDQSFFPAPAQHVQFHGQQDQYQNIPQYQAPFVEHNWSWNLSLQVGSGSSRIDEEEDDRNNYDEYRRDSCVEEEQELDLELRLGHDP